MVVMERSNDIDIGEHRAIKKGLNRINQNVVMMESTHMRCL